MLNGDENESGKKINRSNEKKKTTALHVLHTFLCISLSLICMITT